MFSLISATLQLFPECRGMENSTLFIQTKLKRNIALNQDGDLFHDLLVKKVILLLVNYVNLEIEGHFQDADSFRSHPNLCNLFSININITHTHTNGWIELICVMCDSNKYKIIIPKRKTKLV